MSIASGKKISFKHNSRVLLLSINRLTNIAFPEELHSHDSKYEDDDAQHECEVAQSSNSFAHYGDEQVERRPWLGQFENTQLKEEDNVYVDAPREPENITASLAISGRNNIPSSLLGKLLQQPLKSPF